jgi:hypothetical protein
LRCARLHSGGAWQGLATGITRNLPIHVPLVLRIVAGLIN